MRKKSEKGVFSGKNIFENINKEKLKLDIQNIFSKLRNIINEREDQLLFEVDKQFDNLFFKDELIKKTEKLPNKIKTSLENGKKIIKDWNENKLNFLVNDCINIENNIQEINKLEKIIKQSNLNDSSNVRFIQTEEEISIIIESIKIFGNVKYMTIDIPSEILNNKEDKKLILSWLPKIPNKITLLLNSKKDGDSCKTIIEKCKGKTPTLVVIKTTKDIIFGDMLLLSGAIGN